MIRMEPPQASTALQSLVSLEERLAATGTWSASDEDAAAAWMRNYLHDFDARRCEGLLLQNAERLDPLAPVRAMLFRGRLEEARAEIERLERSGAFSGHGTERAELELELARSRLFAGEWAAALEPIDRALAQPNIALISRLTAHQLRAQSLYEVGELAASLREVEWVESIGSILPHAVPLLYARVLAVRAYARAGAADRARARLDRLWSEHSDNRDELLTLLRTETDLRRVTGGDSLPWAVAGLLVARAMGDRQFEALGLLEIHASASPALRVVIAPALREAAAEFARVARGLAQVEGQAPPCSSYSVVRPQATPSPFEAETARLLSQLDGVDHLAILPFARVADLVEGGTRLLASAPQLVAAISAAVDAPTRPEFFRAVWGPQKYAPHLHDTLISTLLHRLRRKAGLRASVRDGRVNLERAWVIR